MMLELAERGHPVVNSIEQNQNAEAGSSTAAEADQEALDQTRANRNRSCRRFHDRDLVGAVHDLRDVHFLEVVSQAIVKSLQPIDLALYAIEQGEPLAQIERLGFPLLDI